MRRKICTTFPGQTGECEKESKYSRRGAGGPRLPLLPFSAAAPPASASATAAFVIVAAFPPVVLVTVDVIIVVAADVAVTVLDAAPGRAGVPCFSLGMALPRVYPPPQRSCHTGPYERQVRFFFFPH